MEGAGGAGQGPPEVERSGPLMGGGSVRRLCRRARPDPGELITSQWWTGCAIMPGQPALDGHDASANRRNQVLQALDQTGASAGLIKSSSADWFIADPVRASVRRSSCRF